MSKAVLVGISSVGFEYLVKDLRDHFVINDCDINIGDVCVIYILPYTQDKEEKLRVLEFYIMAEVKDVQVYQENSLEPALLKVGILNPKLYSSSSNPYSKVAQ